jgi:hypothetical protein
MNWGLSRCHLFTTSVVSRLETPFETIDSSIQASNLQVQEKLIVMHVEDLQKSEIESLSSQQSTINESSVRYVAYIHFAPPYVKR